MHTCCSSQGASTRAKEGRTGFGQSALMPGLGRKVQASKPRPSDRIPGPGTGTGWLPAAMLRRPPWNVLGSTRCLSPLPVDAYETCRKKYRVLGKAPLEVNDISHRNPKTLNNRHRYVAGARYSAWLEQLEGARRGTACSIT